MLSARGIPANRGACARRYEARARRAAAEEERACGTPPFPSHQLIPSGRAARLISWCKTLSTSHVGLNSHHLLRLHGPLGIKWKLLDGLKVHLIFQQSPTRSQRPMVSSFVPNTSLIYRHFSGGPLRLNIHLEQIARLLHN